MDRRGSMEAGLIGAALATGLAAVLLGWAPLATCDSCRGENRLHLGLRSWACGCCGDRVTMTILEKWRWRRGAWDRAMRDPDRY